MTKIKYLIIGNSAGAIGAVEAIRQIDGSGSLMIVSNEPYPSYSRPLISDYLAGDRVLEGMLYRPLDFYNRLNINTILGNGVSKLDLKRHKVNLSDGTKVSFEKLLIATGGKPIVPPMEGLNKNGVFTFTTLDDAKNIAKIIDKVQKVVVIGGGLIGISVTEALTKCGKQVTVIELMDRILGAVLDEEASCMAEQAVREAGVDIRTGHTVKKIVGKNTNDSSVGGVILDDGQQLDCDIVIVAIGVVPKTDLAKEAGINVNRGIVVDRHMATSAASIYACGDVSEPFDFIFGANRVVPIWPNAHIGGRIARYNMAGKEIEYDGGTVMNSLKYFKFPVISAGLVNPPADGDYEILSCKKNGQYRRILLNDGKIIAIVFVRDIGKAGIFFGLMREGIDVSDIKDSLLDDDFGLASLPEEVWERHFDPIEAIGSTRV